MSMTQRTTSFIRTAIDPTDIPGSWITALARFTITRRAELGLSVSQAAELSGLHISEWYALEDGWAPESLDALRAIAGTLQVPWTEYSTLSSLTRLHQSLWRPTAQAGS